MGQSGHPVVKLRLTSSRIPSKNTADCEGQGAGFVGPGQVLCCEHASTMKEIVEIVRCFPNKTIGDLGTDQGKPRQQGLLQGRIFFDQFGKPVPHTLVEMWQANAGGRYRHKKDSYLAPLDPNFGGVGRCLTDDDGWYHFRTIKPGPYPWPNDMNSWRPAHIHVSVTGPAISTRLITQMYFEGDPLIPLCPIVHTLRDPDAVDTMIGRLDMAHSKPMDCLAYRFDIVVRGELQTYFENQ